MPARITISPTPLHDAPISPLIYGDFIEFLNDLLLELAQFCLAKRELGTHRDPVRVVHLYLQMF